MPKSISVYDDPKDTHPTRHVTSRTAEKLTFTGWYEWRGRRKVVRLEEKQPMTHVASPIPDKLPPVELPGLRFELVKGERQFAPRNSLVGNEDLPCV